MFVRPAFTLNAAQSDEERFLVVLWWSVAALVGSALVGRRHWRTLVSVWVSVYAALLAVYVVLFADLRRTRRNFYPSYFGTRAAFDSTIAPTAPYTAVEWERSQPPPNKTYVALPISEIRGARPDHDALIRAELEHRIEYGHYADNPDPSLVRPRWGARTDIPGVLGGVW